MDVFYASALSLLFVVFSLTLHMVFNKSKHAVKGKLPPGNKGWLVIGETFEFLGTGRNGHPEKFFTDRMAKFSREVFRTSLLREDAAVFCGSAGNKFLFSNENKLVRLWWPSSVHKIFPTNQMSPIEDLKMRTMLLNCLKPESLYQYVPIMDMVTQTHFENEWKDKNEIVTYELVKNLTFSLTCKIFLSIDEPTRVKNLSAPFGCVTLGILSIPIDLPGTRFRKGINAANFIRKELIAIIKQRKSDLSNGKASSKQDMLSYMVLFSDENGEQMTENNIADKILGLLIAGHDTVSSACSLVVKFLSEFPEVYEGVYAEQMDIARSKESGELLNRNDILKMKYSWNVACEILRLAPPLQGAFREAITDFVYNGYSIPKGWKLYWSTFSTHTNPEYFPEPQKFDPSRFDGKGPAPYTFVPFGGGPRMCPGKEFARMQILIIMHHLVRKFKWEKVFPEEKIIMNPLSVPAMGLPIRLYPRKA